MYQAPEARAARVAATRCAADEARAAARIAALRHTATHALSMSRAIETCMGRCTPQRWTTAAFVASVGVLFALLAPVWRFQVRAMDPDGRAPPFFRAPSSGLGWFQVVLGVVMCGACTWEFVRPAFTSLTASTEAATNTPVYLPRGGPPDARHAEEMRDLGRPPCGFAS
jgi:hypothetical protein